MRGRFYFYWSHPVIGQSIRGIDVRYFVTQDNISTALPLSCVVYAK